MPKNIAPPKEDLKIRCPRLGHQIHFAYCRMENQGLPCTKALDCWYHYFNVEDHLKQELSEAEWEKAFIQHAKPKMLSLVELIEQAKQLKKEGK